MNNEKDISLYWAMLFLILTSLFIGFMAHFEFIIASWSFLIPTFYQQKEFVIIVLASFILNILLILAIFERTFGHKKQGSRLRSIKGEKSERVIFKSLILTVIIYLPCHWWIFKPFIDKGLSSVFYKLGNGYIPAYNFAIVISFFVTMTFLVNFCLNGMSLITSKLKYRKKLSHYTGSLNTLLMGSVGEEESFDGEKNPRWIEMNQKALNGNILVTGSIGSGKTQGTILTYVDQILKNFNPRPSILILDPKGTFIPEIRKLSRTLGLRECE